MNNKEYTNKLETRIGELEKVIYDQNVEIEKLKNGDFSSDRVGISLNIGNNRLVGLYIGNNGGEGCLSSDNSYTLVFVIRKEILTKRFFKNPIRSVEVIEYHYESELGNPTIRYLNRFGDISDTEREMIINFKDKCLALGYIVAQGSGSNYKHFKKGPKEWRNHE